MNAPANSSVRHRPDRRIFKIRMIGSFAAVLLLVALTAGYGARGADGASASVGPEATATPTPAATQSPDITPTPTPDHPPLQAFVVVIARTCLGTDGVCDVDESDLTFKAEFDGARIVDSMPYDGFASWSLELPGTAFGIGPGGTVRAVLTAAPVDVFRVPDVDCYKDQTSVEDERPIPSTLEGNSVAFELEVTPIENSPSFACIFTFDPASVPRFTAPPTVPRFSPPPTDAKGTTTATSDDIGGAALLVIAGLGGGVLVLTIGRFGPSQASESPRPSASDSRPLATRMVKARLVSPHRNAQPPPR